MQLIQVTGLVLLYTAHFAIFVYNLGIEIACFLKDIFGIFENLNCNKRDYTFRLPMITYPDCQACDCSQDLFTKPPAYITAQVQATGSLSYLSSSNLYKQALTTYVFSGSPNVNIEPLSIMGGAALGGFSDLAFNADTNRYKLPISNAIFLDNVGYSAMASKNLPLGERIN